MSVKKSVLLAMAVVIVLGAGFAAAQTTTYEIKQGTVVHVYGNHLVVKMSTGETKDVEVPEGFMFTVDGKSVPLSALKPGTKLTSTVKTTTTPHVVQTTEVRNGEIIQRQGRNVIIRDEQWEVEDVQGRLGGPHIHRGRQTGSATHTLPGECASPQPSCTPP